MEDRSQREHVQMEVSLPAGGDGRGQRNNGTLRATQKPPGFVQRQGQGEEGNGVYPKLPDASDGGGAEGSTKNITPWSSSSN